MNPSRRFEGKIAIVTGAAGGIGQAIAARLAREGASVLLADLNETGAAVAASLSGAGLTVDFLRVDITSADDCAALVQGAVDRWGGLDLLVNNAGIGAGALLPALEEATFDAVVDVNLKGVFLCSRAAWPAFRDRGGGVIVNMASLAGMIGGMGMSAYASSKAGVIQLTRVLAVEGAPCRIRVNALCPAWIDTPMVQSFLTGMGSAEEFLRRRLKASIPFNRFGTPEEVAAAALFLASDEASFITGVALPVDGGAQCQ
jgi:NAD(P)-dependent dehydrogenase (short-subunit alcohol dehydrogenase family)